jgi:peptide/nickel transport system ATP-binding protein
MALLEVNNLSINCGQRELVHQISFAVEKGECMALIGESGSGKSITAAAIGNILSPGLVITGGEIRLNGKDMRHLSPKELRKARGELLAYIFQDYQNAFTPFIKIGKQMHEMINAHENIPKNQQQEMIFQSFEMVALEPARVYGSYPFQLSGGQLQRCAIAMAMLLRPALLIADEPTTALDSVSTSTVLSLIEEVKEKLQCSVLFITHDLRTVKRYADQMAIMYKGNIVESGTRASVLANPQHSYTRNLFAAVPPLRDVPTRLPVLALDDSGI